MNQGLADFRVRRFQNGGFSIGAADPSSTAVGLGGLTAPAVSVGTPVGAFNVTPMDVMSLAVPALAVPNMAINAINALAAMTAQQDPAPISDISTYSEEAMAEAEAAAQAQADAVAATQASVDAQEAQEGLAAMNAMSQAQAEEGVASDVDSVANAVAAAQDAADAADAAATGFGGESDAGPGEGGGAGGSDSGGFGSDAGPGEGSGTGSSGGEGGGGPGEKAGGLIEQKRYRYGGGIMSYAQGGMPNTGQSLASQGRYGDSMLVHMTPQEVGGLQTLARSQGTSMTVNPNTGLPEAFNLNSFLPAIAGAGLAMIPGMQLNPLTIGLLTGGLGAAMTGDLRQGLMMGLGAAGGAGMAGSLANLAAPAATAPGMAGVAGQGIRAALPETAIAGSDYALTNTAGAGGQGLALRATPQAFAPASDMYSLSAAPGGGGIASPAGAVSSVARTMTPATLTTPLTNVTPSTVGQGFSTAVSSPSTAYDFAKSNVGNIGRAVSPVLASALEPPKPGEREKTGYRPYELGIENLSGQGDYGPGSTYEREQLRYRFSPQPMYYAAQGGSIGIDEDLDVDTGQIGAYSDTFADGGLAAFKRGIFLNGSGDGMSDSIPAVIANKQPARLADGEFVVPADVVSGLGNGSSNAGAKQLHAMMDRVRQGRTGKKRQAPEIKPDKYMPA